MRYNNAEKSERRVEKCSGMNIKQLDNEWTHVLQHNKRYALKKKDRTSNGMGFNVVFGYGKKKNETMNKMLFIF